MLANPFSNIKRSAHISMPSNWNFFSSNFYLFRCHRHRCVFAIRRSIFCVTVLHLSSMPSGPTMSCLRYSHKTFICDAKFHAYQLNNVAIRESKICSCCRFMAFACNLPRSTGHNRRAFSCVKHKFLIRRIHCVAIVRACV